MCVRLLVHKYLALSTSYMSMGGDSFDDLLAGFESVLELPLSPLMRKGWQGRPVFCIRRFRISNPESEFLEDLNLHRRQ